MSQPNRKLVSRRLNILSLEDRLAPAAFTAGNLAIYRVGDGDAALGSSGTAVFIDEYTPAGSLVQSIPMPTSVSGANKQLVASGSATSEGLLTRTTDGQYLVLTGYAANVGTATIAGTTSAAVNRVVGRVSGSGAIDTSTGISDFPATGNPRSVASTNGTDFWVTSSANGIRYATLGSSSSTSISTTVTNLRHANIFGGQLYVSTSSGSGFRIGAVGTGTPTTTGQTTTNIPNGPITGQPYGFFFADLNAGVVGLDTLYVADENAGVTKYSLVTGSWTANGTVDSAEGYTGLTGVVTGTTVKLYATRGNNRFVSLTDATGYNGTFSTVTSPISVLANASTNTAFRGIALAPVINNVAPVLQTTSDFSAINEDDVTNNGNLVSSLYTATDADAGALSGIAVTSVNTSAGTWQYSLNGGTSWTNIGTVSDAAARLLPSTARVRLVPAANTNGGYLFSFQFRVWDQTSGTVGGTGNTSPNGGTTAFSSGLAQVSIMVNPLNDAPSGTDKTLTLLEDSSITITAADFGFSDANDVPPGGMLAVRITTLPALGTLRNNGSTFVAGTTISIADLLANRLTYTPVANGAGTGYSSFTFQVQDNGGTPGVDLDPSPNTITFNVTPVNDPPAGTDRTITTNEDTQYTFSAADFPITDPLDSPANALLNVRLASLPSPTGSLTYNGSAATVGQLIPAANINLLRYQPGANASGSPYASFTFQLQDNGGTANGGINLDASPNTITINVNPVNDAPSGADRSATIVEDASYTFTTADFPLTDTNDTPENTLLAVTITTLPTAGTLRLNGNTFAAGTSISLAALTGNQLVYTPALGGNGSPYASFTFQVQDNGTTANGGLDLDQSPNTFTFNVTPKNSAPAGTNGSVTALEDTQYTFAASNFGFTDPLDTPSNNFVAVTLTTLPGLGTLTLNGGNVSAGQSVTVADINAGLLKYMPVANGAGNNYTTFTFQVQDDGGTVGGGIDLDASPNTLTINVTPVNDAPDGTDGSVDTDEDTALTLRPMHFGFTDPLDTPANLFNAVILTTLPGTGTLQLNGGNVTIGQSISFADLSTSLLKYIPPTNAHGAPLTSFTFQVQDNGGTANGGVNLDPSANTLLIRVTNVNDAPAGTDTTVSTNEDTQFTFTTSNFGFTDPNDAPANNLLAVKIATLPTPGTLTLNGSPVTANQVIPVADITGGLLKYTPATNGNGSPYATFTFQVQDNGGTVNGGVDLDPTANTLTINVGGVNDAPAGADATVSTNEDTQYTFTTSNFGFSDPNDAPANTLLAVRVTTLPSLGMLTRNGSPVSANQVIPVADITGGLLRYTPATNGSGANYASFTFQVQDNGGIANGGVDLDPTANTLTINVISVNDAPSGADGLVSTNEDTQYTFTTGDFVLTDANDTPANTLQAVRITTLPSVGTLLNGVTPVNAGDLIAVGAITGGSLKFVPVANAHGTPYTTFTFQVQDNGGTASGGIDLDPTANTLTINVVSVNDAPAGTDTTVSTNEDTQYTFTTSNFGFSDPNDAPANTLLAVKIATLPTLGTLTLNGSPITANQVIPVADITGGLLKYTPATNGSGAPYATFTFQVQDNGGTANGGVDLDPTANTLTINVGGVNDAPAGTDTSVSTNEDTQYTFTTSNFGFSDPNDAPANTLLAVKIAMLPTLGTLTLNGSPVTPNQVIPVADITGGLLKYTPATNGNGLPYTTFTFQVQDNGGIANGGVDLDPSANTLTINVISVNDAPAGTDATVSTNEDTQYTFTTGNFGFTDVNDSPANALNAVRLASLPALGSLTLSGSPVSVGQFIAVADITSGNLRYTPATNGSGASYANFTFQVQDNGGTASGGIDLDPTANTLTINVVSVNDAPAGTDATVSTNEDTQYTFTTSNFGFSDPNDAPANTLLAVKIATLPTPGTLTLNGSPITANQVIPVADITGGLLKYTPATNGSGAPYATFTFQVQDNGGTANGGVDLDPTANTLTINVGGVNDAPAGTDATVSTNEDTQYTFTTGNFGFTDVNDAPANTVLAVRLASLPALGSLTLNGSPVSVGQFIAAADITGGLLTYTPATNATGSPYANFTFQVQDNGGTANGGVDLDPTANTLTINVVSVNDAPAGADTTVSTNEDTQYTFTTSNFGFTDPNDAPANTLLAVRVTTLPSLGMLTLNGSPVSANQSIAVADITGGLLKYTPATNDSGSPYTTFTFQVQDNGGIANGGVDLDPTANTLTINVISVNDAPAGADATVSTNEDTQYTFTTGNFGFTDVNDAPANALNAVRIASLPALGSLTLSGSPVSVGQFISVANITAGNLRYTPATNGSGANYASFTFQVQDDGTTANGGVDLDPSANTLTINVASINDAPAGADGSITTLEDTQYTFTTSNFTFSDPSDAPANTLLAVKIASLPTVGSLTLSGSPVSVGQAIPVADITGGLLKYTPAANGSGSPYATFTFQVQDNGGTANGGVDLDPTANTLTINVTPVNDAPSGIDNTVSTSTNTPYVFTPARFTFSDAADSPANALNAVQITSLPTLGSLTLNNVPVTVGQLIPASNIASGQLAYTPLTGGMGIPYTSFTFQVQDNGGTLNGGVNLDATPNTLTINVSDLAPTATITTNLPSTILPATRPVVARNVPYTFTVSDYVDNVGQNNTFSLRWDWDGDGVQDPEDQFIPSLSFGAAAATRTFSFPTLGLQAVRITITDNGTNTFTTYTQPVEVRGVAVTDDGELQIGGTSGPNAYVLDPGATPGTVRVYIDGAYQGTFGPNSSPPVTSFNIYGRDANDTLTLIGTSAVDDFELGADTPAGPNAEQTLKYLGFDVTASSIENVILRGGDGGDRFTIKGIGLTPGSTPRLITIEGGNGADVVFSELTSTAAGPNGRADWIIEGPERGSLEGVLSFTTMSAIVGNELNDHFQVLTGGSMPGTATWPGLTGAGGTNTADISNAATSASVFVQDSGTLQTIAGLITDIQALIGPVGSNDRLVGASVNSTWDITASNAGTYTRGTAPLTFSGFEAITAGAANDTFNFGPAGSLTGTLDGGLGTDALRYPGRTSVVNVTLAPATATSIGGAWTNIENVHGSNANNTLTATNSTNTWTLTSLGGGTLNALTFSNFPNLVGGTSNDQFILGETGAVTSIVAGRGNNILSYAAATTGVNVQLTSTTAGSGTRLGSFTGISTLTGGSGADTLTGTTSNDTFAVSGVGSGTLNTSFAFNGVEHLAGGNANDTFTLSTSGNLLAGVSGGAGNDTLITANVASLFDITGPNSGTLNLLTFDTTENLTGGSGNDLFKVSGGTLSGTAAGGTGIDTLNVGTGGTLYLTNNSATGLAKISGFDKYVAVNGTLAAPNLANTWRLTASNEGTLNTTVNFTGFATLLGGTGQDRVFVQTGGVTGVLNGGGGTDTLDYLGVTMSRPYNSFVGTLANGQFRTGLVLNPLMNVQLFEAIANNL